MRVLRLIIISFSLIGISAVAYGFPITYSESVVGSGTLGSIAFTNRLITITAVADSSTLISDLPGLFEVYGPGGVQVAGIGTGTFGEPYSGPSELYIFNNQTNSGAGISDIIDTLNPVFATYSLLDSITASGEFVGNFGELYPLTGGGALIIDSVVGDSTFTASPSSPVPELSPLIMLFTGGLIAYGTSRAVAGTKKQKLI